MNEWLVCDHRHPKRGSKVKGPGFRTVLTQGGDESAHRVRVAPPNAMVSGQRLCSPATFAERAKSVAPGRDARPESDEVRDLYDNAPCGYHSIDAAGSVVRINATELGWLGYARDEVV